LIVLRLATALFLVQAGFHAYTATMPLALARAGTPDAAIGLVMGAAALVQIPTAITGGRLLDAFGGNRLFTVGAVAYLAATGVLLLPGVEPGASLTPFIFARLLQGIGIALAVPAALTIVPHLVPAARLSSGIAYVSAAQNLTLVVLPPISIWVLNATSLDGVAAMVVGVVLAGMLLGQRLPARVPAAVADPSMQAARRRYGIAYRREWTVPLLIVLTYVAHWGAVTAYLPVRAETAGADIGLYFAADGIGIFLMRVPTGRLVERFTPRTLILTGAGMTMVAIGMLLLPLATPMLILSGLLSGAGGAMVLTPVTIELSRRSTAADRGSAFSLSSGSLATAIALGAIGGAPIVTLFGLSAALAVGIGLLGVSMALAATDRSLAEPMAGEPPLAVAPQVA
jgi:MFS transporter, DHA1 family, multidrug resistance protein